LSFSFGRFFCQNVAFIGLPTFKTAVAGASKTLGSTAIGLDFWHLFAPMIKMKSPLKKTQQGKMRRP
jgi:hypothetical protein